MNYPERTVSDSWNQLCELEQELRRFYDRIADNLIYDSWVSKPTEQEQVFNEMYSFFNIYTTNGHFFEYLCAGHDLKKGCEAIGAVRFLNALEILVPLRDEVRKLESEDEKNEFWQRSQSKINSAEELAEDCLEFGRLVLRYARQNEKYIGTLTETEN